MICYINNMNFYINNNTLNIIILTLSHSAGWLRTTVLDCAQFCSEEHGILFL